MDKDTYITSYIMIGR